MGLERNVEEMLNTAIILRLLKQGPEDFYNKMRVNPSLEFVTSLSEQLKELSLEKTEYFEEVKIFFLSELDRIKNYYKFDNKTTL